MFDEVSELVRAMVSDELGSIRVRSHRRGVKVWFNTELPTKEHYEAQLLSRRYVDGSDGMALEVGFHSEHKNLEDNMAVLDRVAFSESTWREVLGAEPVAGTFYGADNWRRVSESWIEPDLDDPDLAFEIAARLVDYVEVIEPARLSGSKGSPV